jgi:multidrug efflux system membrane fusion protein
MKKPLIIVSSCLLALVILVVFASCHKRSKPVKDQSVTVSVSSVTEKSIDEKTKVVGNVQASATVSIRSRVDGQLLALGFKEGDYVKAGQLLFSIDPRSYQVSLEQSEANLARDQATYNNSKLTLERNAPLAPKGYIARQDFDQMKANVASQEAVVKADMAAVENARLQLSYCTIQSPINGRTGSVLVNVGNLVRASDTTPLLVINQISPIYVSFALPEQRLGSLQEQLLRGPVTVTAQIDKDAPDQTVQGTLSFVDNTVDTTTGTVQLKATFPNEDQKLWPGEFVTVNLPIARLTNVLIVPTEAVQAGPRGTFVYLLDTQLNVHVQLVTTGPEIDSSTVIKDGLKLGDKVVTAGQMRLTDGSHVRIAKSSQIADLN